MEKAVGLILKDETHRNRPARIHQPNATIAATPAATSTTMSNTSQSASRICAGRITVSLAEPVCICAPRVSAATEARRSRSRNAAHVSPNAAKPRRRRATRA